MWGRACQLATCGKLVAICLRMNLGLNDTLMISGEPDDQTANSARIPDANDKRSVFSGSTLTRTRSYSTSVSEIVTLVMLLIAREWQLLFALVSGGHRRNVLRSFDFAAFSCCRARLHNREWTNVKVCNENVNRLRHNASSNTRRRPSRIESDRITTQASSQPRRLCAAPQKPSASTARSVRRLNQGALRSPQAGSSWSRTP
mgnify:CR=1 FL=1